MEPPPASLAALVQNGPRTALGVDRGATWPWVVALVAGVALIAYLVGLHR